jgi:hypothetical protein
MTLQLVKIYLWYVASLHKKVLTVDMKTSDKDVSLHLGFFRIWPEGVRRFLAKAESRPTEMRLLVQKRTTSSNNCIAKIHKNLNKHKLWNSEPAVPNICFKMK